MASRDALEVYLDSLGRRSYYDILRLQPEAPPAAVKTAFHEFSLLYHPDRYAGSEPGVREVAGEIYKRGVEAYRCLSRAPLRERYDAGLRRGQLRLDAAQPVREPPPPVRTLEMIARTEHGKRQAVRADRLITAGRLNEARVQLVGACQSEPENEELADRLRLLYEAIALQ